MRDAPLILSLEVAGCSTAISVVVGGAMAYLLARAALAFARALGDFGATLMVGGNIPGRTHTLSLAVYDAFYSGDNQTANGLALLLTAIAVFVGVSAARLSHRE